MMLVSRHSRMQMKKTAESSADGRPSSSGGLTGHGKHIHHCGCTSNWVKIEGKGGSGGSDSDYLGLIKRGGGS